MTREDWLLSAASALKTEVLAPKELELPKVSVSVGWPRGSKTSIGQCWDKKAAADEETFSVFISPILTDSVQVLGVLLHELLHASLGLEVSHGAPFKKAMKAVGLSGKATATEVAEGSELYKTLATLSEELGPYPHVALRAGSNEGEGKEKKKKGGWVRLQSPQEPKYTVVVSPKNIEAFGLPQDPWGNEMVEKE